MFILKGKLDLSDFNKTSFENKSLKLESLKNQINIVFVTLIIIDIKIYNLFFFLYENYKIHKYVTK